uniref:Uncharacterized protein n=1 Tax=Pseudomonas putida TaxID=303 RepID=A0A6B7PWP6_PSEPU|nr:hypothetical protein [Pseudomonas putida]
MVTCFFQWMYERLNLRGADQVLDSAGAHVGESLRLLGNNRSGPLPAVWAEGDAEPSSVP